MRALIALGLLATLTLADGAAARDISIKAFYGKWGGSAVSNNRDSLYFGVTVRDMDVTVREAAGGFRIDWTTVMRRGGTPRRPKIRRKTTSLTFVGRGRPGQYLATDLDKGEGGMRHSWARIAGNTLTIYIFDVDARGLYELSSYARTLSGSGMDLAFKLIKDGEPVRVVKGKLVKHAN